MGQLLIGAIIADISAGDIYAIAATFAAFALVGATLYLAHITQQYVGETRQYVKLTKELVQAQTNPFVYVGMQWRWNVQRSDKSELKIFIKNVGKSLALDIDFIEVKDDFALWTLEDRGTERRFEEVWFVDHGVRGLAPEQEITLACVTHNAVEQIRKVVEVTLTYKNTRGDSIRAKYPLDFPGYFRMRC